MASKFYLKITETGKLTSYLHTLDSYKPSTLETFINKRHLQPDLSHTHPTVWFPNFLLQDQDVNTTTFEEVSESLNTFLFIRQSTITSFFALNMIDMPLCFKKSKSLYSTTFELPTLKLSNMLMRDGNREKIFKNLTLSLDKCYFNLIKAQHVNYVKWSVLYSNVFNLSTALFTQTSTYKLREDVQILRSLTLTDGNLHLQSGHNMVDLLLAKINEFLPLFSFYIRKVDKSIRKHSRGKSGKYTIIWKYIPTYKRLFVTMRWFLKDLKFQKARTLDARLYKTIETFFLSPDLSFVAKLRRFSHFFVFQNYKKTLMRSLKSVS